MTRPILVSFVLALGIGCGGGTPAANEPAPAEEAPGTATPDPVAAPQMPEVAGEVIGLPGAPVPGLSATYVTTGLGWLGSTEDEVVFEGVIQWTDTTLLGCGILRRAPDGTVHTVLMQDQVLPNTGFGRVKHPRLPLESNETTLLIPAGVEGGTISRGLFAVPKHGGAPVLIAAEATGLFVGAEFTDDGRVIAEVDRDGVRVVLVIEPGADPLALCEGCAPGFSSDGTCVVVHDHDRAERIELDGAAATIVAVGDPAPGSAGSVTAVRDAWTTPSGDLVVHLQTDDAARPDVLIRIRAGQVDLLAACGAPAPGTNGTFDEIRPARGEYDDVVFGATVAGDPESGGAIFCALRGGATEILWKDGGPAPDVPGAVVGLIADAVAAAPAGAAVFGGHVFTGGAVAARGVFRAEVGPINRILTTDAPVRGLADTTLTSLPDGLQDAIRTTDDGRTLVYAGLTQSRRPTATLHALILVR